MKYKNPMAFYTDIASKRRAFHAATAEGGIARDKDGREYLLRDLNIDDVEYIGGAWRVQNKIEGNIQMVRGAEFVLGERINRTERNLFEFYYASRIGTNCYGHFIIPRSRAVVAKYETDTETHWAYGNSIEQARAFLGISLYDKYMDLIHSVACKKKLSRNGK